MYTICMKPVLSQKQKEQGGATTGIVIIILILILAGYAFYKMTQKQIEANKTAREAEPQTIQAK